MTTMTPNAALDRVRPHEIEQQLGFELNLARDRTELASTEEEKRNVLEAYLLALQRYTEFAAKGIVPEEFF